MRMQYESDQDYGLDKENEFPDIIRKAFPPKESDTTGLEVPANESKRTDDDEG